MTDTKASKRSRFTPRRTTGAAPSQRRLPLSFLLLGIGIALAVAVTSWLGFLANGKDVSLEIKEVEGTETSEVQLTGARYRGLTPGGKPYEITAALANESPDGSGRVDMDQPTAVVTLRNGSIVNLQSNVGVFNKQTDVVTMSGAVVVTQPNRHLRLDTEALVANLKAGEMHSDLPVLVQDIDRRINADSMRAYDNGSRIIFGGTTKMIIKNKKSTRQGKLH
ncbi:LPS export ABC transporter periplasmic protein LptC [Candidatus Puniceispirillum sp.]|nr:LPS export ABC transporter periplasmic protein LptC [Candidatus Puniceispirillum sp.]